jgi:hypothetical protein
MRRKKEMAKAAFLAAAPCLAGEEPAFAHTLSLTSDGPIWNLSGGCNASVRP